MAELKEPHFASATCPCYLNALLPCLTHLNVSNSSLESDSEAERLIGDLLPIFKII